MATKKDILVDSVFLDRRLDKTLKEYFSNTPFSMFQRLIRKKLITVNGKKQDASYRIKKGDKINIVDFVYNNLIVTDREESEKKLKDIEDKNISKQEISRITSCIIYKDENILALNKPYDLPVQGGTGIKRSVVDYLPFLKFYKKENPKLVHRLDRHTTGVLLIARNSIASNILLELFKEKNNINKKYYAVIIGKPSKKQGTINFPLIKKHDGKVEKVYVDNKLGKKAITEYRIISYSEKYNISLVELSLITGRTHQIRVHLKEIGYPILGDGKYGDNRTILEGFSKKLHLHAGEVNIDCNKLSAKTINIKALLPEHFKQTFKKAGL